MKKKLITILLLSYFNNIALADSIKNYDTLYIRGDIGAAKLGSSIHLEDQERDIKLRMKPKVNSFISIGAGYSDNNGHRAELLYSHFYNPHFRGSDNGTETDSVSNKTYNIYANSKYKFSADSLILKGIVDVYNFGFSNLYFEAGAGIARISSKLKVFSTHYDKTVSRDYSSKRVINPAFVIGAGLAFNLTESSKLT